MHCPDQVDPAGQCASRVSEARWPPASARWCWCSTICTLSPIPRVWTRSRSSSGTCRQARRWPLRAGKSRHCRLPAGERRDRWRRSASHDLRLNEHEAELLLVAAGVEVDASELSELTERTEGWPAGLYLAALSMQDGGGKLGRRRGLQRRRPVRVRLLPLRAPFPAAGGRGAVLRAHVDTGSHVRGPVRRRAPDDRVGTDARDHRAHESLRRPARPAGRVVPLPPPVRPAAQERARARRAGGRARAQRSCDGVVHRERPARGGNRLRARCRREGDRRRPDRCPQSAALLRRPPGDRGGVARVVRRRRACALPRTCCLWSLVACADGASRGGGALAGPRRRGSLENPTLGRQRHDRAVGRHAARAHDVERCRAGARRRRWGARSALGGQFLGPYRTPRPRSRARPARRDRSCSSGPFRNR